MESIEVIFGSGIVGRCEREVVEFKVSIINSKDSSQVKIWENMVVIQSETSMETNTLLRIGE